ncbi:hypothetical protein JOAD_123 [Erwinia phage vB_EamM_Joad]|uniref:Uncharacterized protein n=1 Tax=Erwinia phage vB_EamM_Joad TaxID=2026081 RepID=A0A223LIJ0_9CAUD|nr:hypothetical protein JOAD_123 [Erwinia phage vB_EamM_Joad]
MAKRDINYAVERITNSLSNAMNGGTSQEQLLALYKSRLFDEELVDKDRRNQVLMAVNKELGMDIKMRDVKQADNTLLEQVLANSGETGPEIVQEPNDLPAPTAEFILANREEFSAAEVTKAGIDLHSHQGTQVADATGPVSEVKSANTVNTNSTEDTDMTTNASNSYNTTTSTSAQADTNHTAEEALNKGAETVDETLKAGAEQAKEKAQEATENLADPSFMDKVNSIRPEYLAAGAAVIGAGATILNADAVNAYNLAGGAAGVAASYFGAKHFLGGRENNIVTKSIAVSAGLVTGAALARAGDMVRDYVIAGDANQAADGETVVTIKPVPAPAPVVTVEQPLF